MYFNKNMKLKEIAKIYNVDSSTVSHWFKKYNIEVIKIPPSNKIVLSKRELIDLYKIFSSIEIAKLYNISKQTVLRNLHEYNIKIKSFPKKLPDKKAMVISKKLKENAKDRKEKRNSEMIKCSCGCGELIHKYDKKGRRRYYKKGHSKGGQFKKGFTPWNKDTLYGKNTKLALKIKQSSKYNNWRNAIFKRDNYICQICGKKTRYLNVHHIRYFKEIFEEFLNKYPNKTKDELYKLSKKYKLFWDIDNGTTLCVDCHKKIHSKNKI